MPQKTHRNTSQSTLMLGKSRKFEPRFFKEHVFIYLFWVVLGLSCSMQDLLLLCSGFCLVARRLRGCIQQASLPCSTWNPVSPTRDRTQAPLHWKADSQSLDHRGSS